jgi:hypothetical protein
MFQFLGLILVVLSWLGGYLLISKYYDKKLTTISKHAASNKSASWLFAGILILLGVAFYYWLMVWFAPRLELSLTFQVILTAAIFCQFLAALAPDVIGWRGVVHRWSAWTMAVLYLPLSFLIIASPQLGPIIQILCGLLLAYMLVGFVLVAIMGKAKSKYLPLQASYIVAFQLIILLAAYLPRV